MEFIGAIMGLSVVWWVAVALLTTVVFPLFWIWMLVDSMVRDESDYPGGGSNEKLVWVLLIALVQFAAIVYFFMVYRMAGRRSPTAAAAHPTGSVGTSVPRPSAT